MNSFLFKTLAVGVILMTHSMAADESTLAAYRERLFEYNRLADLAEETKGNFFAQEKAFQNLQSEWDALGASLRRERAFKHIQAGENFASQQVNSGDSRSAAETLKKVGDWAAENSINLGYGTVAAFEERVVVRAKAWTATGSDPFVEKVVGYEMVKLNDAEYLALREDPVSKGKRNQATEATGTIEDLPSTETLGDLILVTFQSDKPVMTTAYAAALHFPLSDRPSLQASLAAAYVHVEPSATNSGGYARKDSKIFMDRFQLGRQSVLPNLNKSIEQEVPGRTK